jgi:RNA polymerase sigma-70 factor (ECF subfamily)
VFDSKRQFLAADTSKVVASQRAERSLEQRQRDVYESHRHRVFAVGFYMTGSEIEAESILTETFVRAFQAAEEPDARVVDTALVERLSEQYPIGEMDMSVPPAHGSSLNGRNILRTELEEAIQVLPVTERLIFLLHDVEGYSPAAVAETLKIAEAKVRRALITARIRLRHAVVSVQNEGREAA